MAHLTKEYMFFQLKISMFVSQIWILKCLHISDMFKRRLIELSYDAWSAQYSCKQEGFSIQGRPFFKIHTPMEWESSASHTITRFELSLTSHVTLLKHSLICLQSSHWLSYRTYLRPNASTSLVTSVNASMALTQEVRLDN